jgi:hypothetical protein
MIDDTRCLAALLALLAACNVDREVVHERVYACDPTAADPGCGTDRHQEPMMCFAGRPLGGSDFCAERCPASGDPGVGAVCSQSGARLASCDPNVADSCGNPRLGCFRNNVLADGGVCVTINGCTSDADCPDPVRSRCATSFVNLLYDVPAAFKNDHLWCLQAECQKHRTACSPGETCLRDIVPPELNAPDICVPSCDSRLRCPPAHFCFRKVSGPGAPAICIPGLLGFRCDSTLDCMMGECTDVGTPFKLCSMSCSDNAECTRYDGQQGRFLCNPAHRCVTPDAFRGSPCDRDGDCGTGLVCARNPVDAGQGNCMPPCDAAGRCEARGGIAHTCLPFPDGHNVCYPGYFEVPCTADDQCLPGLSCRSLGGGQPSVCTSLCASDDECARIRWTSKKPVCRPLPSMGIKVCLSPPATTPTTGARP